MPIDIIALLRKPDLLDELLKSIDLVARQENGFEYGLPLHGEANQALLRETVLRWAAEHGGKPPKCDGNHGGPRCADPECWNDSPAGEQQCEILGDSFTSGPHHKVVEGRALTVDEIASVVGRGGRIRAEFLAPHIDRTCKTVAAMAEEGAYPRCAEIVADFVRAAMLQAEKLIDAYPATASEQGEPDDIEAIIACLGDDAATLRDESPEIADNLDAAAEALRKLTQRPAALTWPKARDIGRFGDMSPGQHLRVGLDSDNDVYVSVWDEDSGASVEFCNPGGGGGGSSTRTRTALIALMVAMEADNAERPDKDWWALRNGAKTEAKQDGAA
jgi:hypothetical protein